MLPISPIQPHQVTETKRMIYTVAMRLFHDPEPLEEIIAICEARGELRDLDDIQACYIDRNGAFLVMLDSGRVVGSGALRTLTPGVCEIKRLWFYFEYHGQGHGYRMLQALLAIARGKKYHTARLETDPVHQARAVAFYRQAGFHQIPRYGPDESEIAFEMAL